MANGAAALVIANEEDAWSVLERALNGEFDEVETATLELQGWPTLEVWIKEGEASIKPGLMRGFVALQAGLYHAYGTVLNSDPSIRRLTDEEKRALEFSVKVGEGSSNFHIDWQEALHTLIKSINEKMEPRHWIITGSLIGLLFLSDSAYKEYLQYQLETRRSELAGEETAQWLEHLRFAEEADLKRFELIAKAIEQIDGLSDVAEQSDEAKKEMLRSTTQYGESRVGSTALDPKVVSEVLKRARSRSVEHEISGEFSILQVDTTKAVS